MFEQLASLTGGGGLNFAEDLGPTAVTASGSTNAFGDKNFGFKPPGALSDKDLLLALVVVLGIWVVYKKM
jgi:hypothetical protein